MKSRDRPRWRRWRTPRRPTRRCSCLRGRTQGPASAAAPVGRPARSSRRRRRLVPPPRLTAWPTASGWRGSYAPRCRRGPGAQRTAATEPVTPRNRRSVAVRPSAAPIRSVATASDHPAHYIITLQPVMRWLQQRLDSHSTGFDCLSKVIKVTVTLAAVTLTYLFIYAAVQQPRTSGRNVNAVELQSNRSQIEIESQL